MCRKLLACVVRRTCTCIMNTVLWQNRHCPIQLICFLFELIHLPNCTIKLCSALLTMDSELPNSVLKQKGHAHFDRMYCTLLKKLLFHHAWALHCTYSCPSSTCNSYHSFQRVLLVCYTKPSQIKVIPNWSHHLQHSPRMCHRECSSVRHTTYIFYIPNLKHSLAAYTRHT